MTTTFSTHFFSSSPPAEILQEIQSLSASLQGKQGLALLFIAGDYPYQSLVHSIGSLLPIPLIGCTASAIFNDHSYSQHGVILGIYLKKNSEWHVGFGESLKENAKESVKQAINSAELDPEKKYTLFMLLDTLAGRGEEAVLAAASLLPQASMVGGAAADRLNFKETWVFCNTHVLKNAVSIAAITSSSPLMIGMQNGHHPVSKPLKITKAKGNVLIELDHAPAIHAWREVWENAGLIDPTTPLSLYPSADLSRLLLKFEAGLVLGNTHKVRFPVSANQDGSLNFVCTMVEGSVLQIMDCSNESLIEAARKAASEALIQAQGVPIAGAIVFDCACRSMQLGSDFPQAIAAIRETLKNIPVLGVETYGEIELVKGKLSGFHNTTIVIVLIPQ